MDCPFCPDGREYTERPRSRVSLWAPLLLIAAVLGAASFAATTANDGRDPGARKAVAAPLSRAL